MICLYHSKDLDGYTSGAIVKRKYPDCKLIGWDYKDAIPDFEQFKDEDVIMIDITFPIDRLIELSNTCKVLTVIDHHISFYKDWKALMDSETPHKFFIFIYEAGIAACEIGWKYFFPDEEMPEAVKLLGEYDTWRKDNEERWEKEILPFQYSMRLDVKSAETFPSYWFEENTYIPFAIENGNLILSYQREQDKKLMHSSFVAEFEGLRALCVNVGGASSNTFLSVWDEEKHDVMIPFHYTGSKWTCSIYTTKDDIDCSLIAKKLGGGGHKKASGFMLEKLPDNWKK